VRIEFGAPVVLVDLAGVPGSEAIVHVGRRSRSRRIGTARVRERLADRLRSGSSPANWPTLCGLAGPVYVYDGVLRARRACTVCAARGPEVVEAVEERHLRVVAA
jgi:hypothetical protein